MDASNNLNGLPIRLFKNQKEWTTWLDKNHAAPTGLWLRLAKKGSGLASITYAEAVDVALCYGWIDGQKKPENEQTWLQKFTPRGPKSIWSQVNIGKAEGLIAAGWMKLAGLKAIESAKQDGRWAAAYAPASSMAVPEDLQAELDKNAQAAAFFAALNKTHRYSILFRIHTAKKAETRAKRIQQFIGMLARGEKL